MTELKSENHDKTVVYDAVRGRIIRWRGTIPGGTSMMKRLYEESNARAYAGGYAK